MPLEPPHLRATFDDEPARLSLFLSQVVSHLNSFAHLYPCHWVMVMEALEEETADLYRENAWELGDASLLLVIFSLLHRLYSSGKSV